MIDNGERKNYENICCSRNASVSHIAGSKGYKCRDRIHRLYLPYLENPHFICCFREPMEVAKSLKRRNDMPIKKGLKLAKVYNSRLLKFINDWQKYD